ncbi:hypothetical protein CTAYLR_007659 [Chrysophaeum taylorii]|uniref:3-dehydroquinate dehydratase n=1 Tax=Chrysophaeum taylorii TaxID=2483200 RepID=A0AAD7U624_9STRA|nr:hypothetical protein CTAYLR_007659 [Chrysophaeum taylorii]
MGRSFGTTVVLLAVRASGVSNVSPRGLKWFVRGRSMSAAATTVSPRYSEKTKVLPRSEEACVVVVGKDAVASVAGVTGVVEGSRVLAESANQVREHPISILCASEDADEGVVEALRDATSYEVAPGPEAAAEIRRIEALARRPGLGQAIRKSEVRLDFGDDTFFLSLTYEDLSLATPETLREFAKEVDMLEIRADLLECVQASALAGGGDAAAAARDVCGSVVRQVGALRAAMRAAGCGDMPLLFTARSKNQCGALADSPEAVYALAAVGLRAGVEWLDVEANWPALDKHGFVEWASSRYPGTRLLGSQHVVDADHDVGPKTAVRLLHACALGGRADAVKLVVAARDERDSIAVRSAASEADLDDAPCVAICLGDAGRLSRVLNRVMTPVTHRLLGGAAAPGQLDAKTLMALRRQLFVSRKVFGVASPALAKAHAAAFDRVGLPHVVQEVVDPNDEAFGGAALEPTRDWADLVVSDKAAAVGAVDTIVLADDQSRRSPKTRRGDNALAPALERALGARRLPPTAIVFGADSRAYAPVYALSNLVPTVLVDPGLYRDDDDHRPRLGIPRSRDDDPPEGPFLAVVAGDLDASGADLVARADLVVDARLDPRAPPLPATATATAGLLDATAVLLELADEQQRLWTSRRPPRVVMAEAILLDAATIQCDAH